MSKTPFLDKFYKKYSGDMGKMLVHTGVIGWILSSAAQIMAIVTNDKIKKEQKMFLVPQETWDAIINIVSFYFVTRSLCAIGKKLGVTGKWLPAVVKTALEKKNLGAQIGKAGFKVAEHLKDVAPEIESTYKWFSQGLEVGATTLGAILSCNVITPVIRNCVASKRQKTNIAKMSSPENKCNPLYDNKCQVKNTRNPLAYSGTLKV